MEHQGKPTRANNFVTVKKKKKKGLYYPVLDLLN